MKNPFRIFQISVQENATSTDPYLYAPGIESENNFLEACLQNYDCISKCPHEALQVYRENPEDKRYGFPVIKPEQGACYLCDDFPCITACKSGALKLKNKTRKLGLAVINQQTCFAFNDTYCQSCVINCPLSGKAIYMTTDNKPEISAEHCTGCGICVQSCPVGTSAIYIKANLK